MAGVVPKKLVELNMETTNALVSAVVLSKTEPSFFLAKDTAEYRGVLTFTLRDSKRHIVNCKYWGTKEKIVEYNGTIKIGDIIQLSCPKVLPQIGDSSLSNLVRFQPQATLPYTLVLNERQGFLSKPDQLLNTHSELNELSCFSHKPLSDVLNLADINGSLNVDTAQCQFVDLLVAIATIRPVREVRSTRSDQMLNCLELVVIDSSLTDGMMLTIWNPAWIRRAEQRWASLKTVLHLIDVKVSYSEFYKSTTLTVTACTLIYENPVGAEAQALALFAQSAPTKDFDIFAQSSSLPQPDTILTQMTVKQIYTRAECNNSTNTPYEQFTAVLYAMITKFDIDGQNLIISKKCKSCHRLILNKSEICEFDQCQLAFSLNFSGDKYEKFFNINMQLSDHTGTLVESRISGAVAERILGLSVEEYLRLSVAQMDQLKWRFLLQYFEFKLFVKCATAVRRNLAIIVVDIREISLSELSEKMLIF